MSILPTKTPVVRNQSTFIRESGPTQLLKQLSEQLLSAQDLTAATRAIEPLEFYLLLKELGVEAGQNLLLRATHEQIQLCLDLDCWRGDTCDLNELHAWLAPFAAESSEALFTIFTSLDEELQLFFLSSQLKIYDLQEPDLASLPPNLEANFFKTPDQHFLLELNLEVLEDLETPPEIEMWVLINALYKHDPVDAARLLNSAKGALPTNLLEEAYKFHEGRLLDYGFLPRTEALRLFTPLGTLPPLNSLNPKLLSTAELTLPHIYTRTLALKTLNPKHTPNLFLETLISLREKGETVLVNTIHDELRHLLNSAALAYETKLTGITCLVRITKHVVETLALALDILQKKHAHLPAENVNEQALRNLTLEELFRLSYTAIAPLHRYCLEQKQEQAAFASWYLQAEAKALGAIELPQTATLSESAADLVTILDYYFVKALLNPQTLDSGFNPQNPPETKAFSSQKELEVAKNRLQELIKKVTTTNYTLN